MSLRPALFAAFLLLAGSAQAQINPFRDSKRAPRLAASDLTLLAATGQKLLGEPAPATGTAETWRNEATGAAGTITYLGPASRTVRGTKYACRRLKYEVTLTERPAPRTTNATWCHLPDGTWKLN